MKQQVNPAIFVVVIVLVLGVLVFFGVRQMAPMTPADSSSTKNQPPKPDTINGHKVPDNVPYSYMQQTPKGVSGQATPPTHP